MNWEKKQLVLLYWLWSKIAESESQRTFYNGTTVTVDQVVFLIERDVMLFDDWRQELKAYPIPMTGSHVFYDYAFKLNYATNALRLLSEDGLIIYENKDFSSSYTVRLTAKGYDKGRAIQSSWGRVTRNWNYTFIVALLTFILTAYLVFLDSSRSDFNPSNKEAHNNSSEAVDFPLFLTKPCDSLIPIKWPCQRITACPKNNPLPAPAPYTAP